GPGQKGGEVYSKPTRRGAAPNPALGWEPAGRSGGLGLGPPLTPGDSRQAVLLARYKENYDQARHHEALRECTTAMVASTTGSCWSHRHQGRNLAGQSDRTSHSTHFHCHAWAVGRYLAGSFSSPPKV